MEEMFTIKAGMAVKLREQEIKCKLTHVFCRNRKNNDVDVFVGHRLSSTLNSDRPFHVPNLIPLTKSVILSSY